MQRRIRSTKKPRFRPRMMAVLLSATLAGAAISPSFASPLYAPLGATSADPIALRVGVVVIGVGPSAADASWPIARAVYADASIRPKLSEADARVLAGEPPAPDAPASRKELAELRAAAIADDALGRSAVREIMRKTNARAAVIVALDTPAPAVSASSSASASVAPSASASATVGAPPPAPGVASARVFDAADDGIAPTTYRPEAAAGAPWSALLAVLRARYGVVPATVASASSSAAPIKETPKESVTFYKSPWFWGALGAAAVGVVAAVLLNSGSGSTGAAAARVTWK